jgi:cytochrome c peroxidase
MSKPARKKFKSAGILFSLATPAFMVGITAMAAKPTAAQSGPNPNIVKLGKALFMDEGLSNPSGMACSTCHNPETGFSYPVSETNQATGEVPGAYGGRYGNRKPPTTSYARFIPQGPPTFDPQQNAYVGGLFYDGRAANLADQAQGPLQNPNEMNNLVHNVGSPALVVSEVENGPNADLFKLAYGPNAFNQPTDQIFQQIVQAIAAWENTPDLSPFSSKYDLYVMGKTTLTAAELDGFRLFTGTYNGRPNGIPYVKNAECSSCHALAPAPGQPDLFTNWHYFNIGVPRNGNNPYYKQTNATTDPVGYNPLGENYVDLGLADFLYPDGGLVNGDPLAIKGTFKVPTVRNVDNRPEPTFVKDYGHNGVFKSLPQLVHFYNTRNLTTVPGEVIDFTKEYPYGGLKGRPLWPEPEVPSPLTLVNPAGHATGPGRHLGNLGLTPQQEADLVAFLQTLSDGYFTPPPPGG